MYQTCVRPFLLYCSETWELSSELVNFEQVYVSWVMVKAARVGAVYD